MRIRLAHTSSLFSFAAAAFLLSTSASAQPALPQLPSPPPMRYVAHDDRAQLNATKDAKARVRLTIALAEAHLTHMEELTSHKMFEQASEVLGNYLGLIEEAMRFIGGMPRDKNSTRDLYRRLDIALRAQIPRLAVMRRDTPAEYSLHLKAAEEFARNVRSEALDSFYGHTVLREEATQTNGVKNSSPENKRP
ncbi:MAG TPA: hypothetical protein VGQ72_07135 [Pyrinomonadaceae bacterium]|nr:hypothetical protein [Pyrinomonadaceae bacterium]